MNSLHMPVSILDYKPTCINTQLAVCSHLRNLSLSYHLKVDEHIVLFPAVFEQTEHVVYSKLNGSTRACFDNRSHLVL